MFSLWVHLCFRGTFILNFNKECNEFYGEELDKTTDLLKEHTFCLS
jgi:hypothetical protein